MTYAFGKDIDLPFETALERTLQALQQQGFGVLSDIDVAGTMKKKLDVTLPPYRILGACNPNFALQALRADPQIGLLLPCNVVVRQDEAGQVRVEFMDPESVLQLVGKPEVEKVAVEVRQRLMSALNAI